MSAVFCIFGDTADKGNDAQKAEGNVDGHPRENNVYKNTVSAEGVMTAWRMKNADENKFIVSCVAFVVRHSFVQPHYYNIATVE